MAFDYDKRDKMTAPNNIYDNTARDALVADLSGEYIFNLLNIYSPLTILKTIPKNFILPRSNCHCQA